MSSQDAATPENAAAAASLRRAQGRVYSNLGLPRVIVERGDARIDLSLEEWRDLVAVVGNRIVDWLLAHPEYRLSVAQGMTERATAPRPRAYYPKGDH